MMAPTAQFMLHHPAHFIALGFGAGLAPVAPGTFGTLVAIPIALALHRYAGDAGFAAAVVVLFLAGVWASGVTGRALGVPDHGSIVIDEVVAFLIVPVLCRPNAAADCIRVCAVPVLRHREAPPIRQVDAAMKGGFGVMLDDIVAAGYALLVFALAARALA
jgi:phosphatidylglycerophosphatase A